MKFYPKQFLSAFLTASLVWVFVGCAFLCGENENCGEEFDDSFENSAIFDETSHEDSCPIKASAKTTAPERIVFNFDSQLVENKVFTTFSAVMILPDSLRHQLNIYRPPITTSYYKRPLVLRV
ncbi:MAG: hypothetical protein ACR2F2_07720 [Pyrinomonadaceae bacterium]